MRLEWALLVGSALLLLSVLASKASGRLGVPALLVFIFIGMLAGAEGPGRIAFSNYSVAQNVGVVALAFILFAGGLDTRWSHVRPALGSAISLATLGVLFTAVSVAAFGHFFLGFSPLGGFLLGSIVSSTDAAAVFAVLRGRGVAIPERLRGLLELESGFNDPMAVFLTTGVIALMKEPGASPLRLLPEFLLEMSVGLAAGVGMGRLAVWLANRMRLAYDGLYPVFTIACVAMTYSLAAVLHGSGFLAVYVAGLVMGKLPFVHKRSLTRFHDGVAWLMQIAMFLVLGLLVDPSHLLPVAGTGFLMALALVVLARPLAVFLSLPLAKLPWREKAMTGWVGLRGAVPIVLATFPLLAGIPRAETIFNLVFFVVLTSVLLQGPTIPLVAAWLGFRDTEEHDPLVAESELPIRRESELITVAVPEASSAVGAQIVDLDLPSDVSVLLVYREGGFFVPTGATVLRAEDRVMALASRISSARFRRILEG
ncbi:MAG: potassium/proton antiporter [Acidobacteriota bacterium]|nr:potassium/proton antiporter [Acidobacteriota bacterium]